MPVYTRTEAREWAREKLVGAVNCTIPSFTSDLRDVNEKAIRHDVRLAKQHGFLGTLGVSEVSITLPEYAEEDISEYTKAFCDATNLAGILVPMYRWGFSPRIHPSDIPAGLIRRLLDDCPTIAVIKAEGGFPYIQGIVECHRLFGDEVVISVPIEGDLVPLGQLMPIQLSATSDHEYYGATIPRMMDLLRGEKYDDVSRLFWQVLPARRAKAALAPSMHGGAFINRQMWKFQGWLQGYNGGPLRMPTQRIHDPQMAALRKGLVDAGLEPSMDPFRDFFIGRNPV